jgi:hypothetical protein
MNLAPAAPSVEPATAEPYTLIEPARASMAQQSEAPVVAGSPLVDAATDYIPYNPGVTNGKVALSATHLRGTTGSDFEAYVAILRGAPTKSIRKRREFVAWGEVKRYMIIQWNMCYIFGEKTDASPLFSFPLHELYATQVDTKSFTGRLGSWSSTTTIINPNSSNQQPQHLLTVMLKYTVDNIQAYQVVFDTLKDPSVVKRFLDLVEAANSTELTTTSVCNALKSASTK